MLMQVGCAPGIAGQMHDTAMSKVWNSAMFGARASASDQKSEQNSSEFYIWEAHGCRHFHDSHFLTVYTLLSTL